MSAPLTREEWGKIAEELEIVAGRLAKLHTDEDQSRARLLGRLIPAIPSLVAQSADTARLDWLEKHERHATCYNVNGEKNNGWIISGPIDDEDDDGDCHGNTLRDAIDWAAKCAARPAPQPEGNG